MNKLKTWNDGSYMPVWQSDLAFIQDALSVPLVKLCEALLGKTSGIIIGCEVTKPSGATSITEGWVLMDGEIIFCPPQTISGIGIGLKKLDSYDTDGAKVFKVDDGTDVRQTYYTPYAQLVTGKSPEGGKYLIFEEDGLTLEEALVGAVSSSSSGYEIKEYSNYSQYSISPSTTIHYTKIGKCVHVLLLSGTNGSQEEDEPMTMGMGVGSGVMAIDNEIFTFPAGYKPVRDAYFTYQENNTGNVHLGKVAAADGKIYIGNNRNMRAVGFTYLTA